MVDEELDAGGTVGIDRQLTTDGARPMFPVPQQGDSGKAAPRFRGKAADLTHSSQRLGHVAGKNDDVGALLVEQVERGPGGKLISGEVHIGDLGDAKTVQPRRQPTDPDLVAAEQYPVGLETECIRTDGRPRGADASEEMPATDFHAGRVAEEEAKARSIATSASRLSRSR